jgi:hypothetical protein
MLRHMAEREEDTITRVVEEGATQVAMKIQEVVGAALVSEAEGGLVATQTPWITQNTQNI